MPATTHTRAILAGFAAFLAIATGASLFAYRYWPRKLHAPRFGVPEVVDLSSTEMRVFVPGKILLGRIADFDDGLFAYLMFDYLRANPLLADRSVLLTAKEEQEQPLYRILVRLPDNVIEGAMLLATLKHRGLTPRIDFGWIPHSTFASYLHQTSVFIEAYKGPVTTRLADLHAPELEGYLRRFIRFKSETDPRIAAASGPVPSPLARTDASRLAADIIAAAHFFDLPIDLFLGVGAMENNYMNVAGDLKNTIWKRRAQPGDIVLKRKRGRVLVRNDSMGVWQITRESLRYAHRLYLADKRDYNRLPIRMRPSTKFDFAAIDPEVLTTYAGLLLRNLLDRFHGDVHLAAGAYNGGPGNPNAHYAEGVEQVASYARRVIRRAAELDHVASAENTVSVQKIKQAIASAVPAPPGR